MRPKSRRPRKRIKHTRKRIKHTRKGGSSMVSGSNDGGASMASVSNDGGASMASVSDHLVSVYDDGSTTWYKSMAPDSIKGIKTLIEDKVKEMKKNIKQKRDDMAKTEKLLKTAKEAPKKKLREIEELQKKITGFKKELERVLPIARSQRLAQAQSNKRNLISKTIEDTEKYIQKLQSEISYTEKEIETLIEKVDVLKDELSVYTSQKQAEIDTLKKDIESRDEQLTQLDQSKNKHSMDEEEDTFRHLLTFARGLYEKYFKENSYVTVRSSKNPYYNVKTGKVVIGGQVVSDTLLDKIPIDNPRSGCILSDWWSGVNHTLVKRTGGNYTPDNYRKFYGLLTMKPFGNSRPVENSGFVIGSRSLVEAGLLPNAEFGEKYKEWLQQYTLKPMSQRIAETSYNLESVEERFKKTITEEYQNAYLKYVEPKNDETENSEFSTFEFPFPMMAQLITLDQVKELLSSERMLPDFNWNSPMPHMPIDKTDQKALMLFLFKRRMGIEASTHSNVCSFVSIYCQESPLPEPFLFTEGLIRALRDVHRCVNRIFLDKIRYMSASGITPMRTVWAHSGGNLFVLIASMLLYFCVDNPEEAKDPSSFMEQIKVQFSKHPLFAEFKIQLKRLVEMDPSFLPLLIEISNKLSDIDLLMMTDHPDIETLASEFLAQANLASAQTLREMLRIPPFEFPPFKPFTGNSFLCTSGIEPGISQGLRYTETMVSGSQTSSRIEEVFIFLNRIKLIPELGEECGEFIDLCIGCLENPTYREKLARFLMGDYYTLDMLIAELRAILKKPPDEKTPRRVIRLTFSEKIRGLPGMNDLVRIIGRAISNEDLREFLDWEL